MLPVLLVPQVLRVLLVLVVALVLALVRVLVHHPRRLTSQIKAAFGRRTTNYPSVTPIRKIPVSVGLLQACFGRESS